MSKESLSLKSPQKGSSGCSTILRESAATKAALSNPETRAEYELTWNKRKYFTLRDYVFHEKWNVCELRAGIIDLREGDTAAGAPLIYLCLEGGDTVNHHETVFRAVILADCEYTEDFAFLKNVTVRCFELNDGDGAVGQGRLSGGSYVQRIAFLFDKRFIFLCFQV